jgi:hypothetical protein
MVEKGALDPVALDPDKFEVRFENEACACSKCGWRLEPSTPCTGTPNLIYALSSYTVKDTLTRRHHKGATVTSGRGHLGGRANPRRREYR